MPANDVETMLTEIGFACIQIDKKEQSKEVIATWMPGSGAEDYVVSANISAFKPDLQPHHHAPLLQHLLHHVVPLQQRFKPREGNEK